MEQRYQYHQADEFYRQDSMLPAQTDENPYMQGDAPGKVLSRQNSADVDRMPPEAKNRAMFLKQRLGVPVTLNLAVDGRHRIDLHGVLIGSGEDYVLLRDASSGRVVLFDPVHIRFVTFM